MKPIIDFSNSNNELLGRLQEAKEDLFGSGDNFGIRPPIPVNFFHRLQSANTVTRNHFHRYDPEKYTLVHPKSSEVTEANEWLE